MVYRPTTFIVIRYFSVLQHQFCSDFFQNLPLGFRAATQVRSSAETRSSTGPDAPVFPSKSGKPLDPPAVFRIIQAATRRAGIDNAVSPHWFRHACASHALDNGAPISLVKEQLGHPTQTTGTIALTVGTVLDLHPTCPLRRIQICRLLKMT
jgi:site-specific recombinase XerC